MNKNNILRIIGFLTVIFVGIFVILKFFTFSKPPENDDSYYDKMHEKYMIFSPFIPNKVDFAGEKVPIERFDVFEALDYEMLKVMYWHSETILYIKRKARIFPIIEPILKKYGIPDDFKYLLVAESGMVNVVSPSKAAGYWQFMKKTALDYDLQINEDVDERYDLEKSTEAACKYLLDSYKVFGNWTLAAASYNVGREAMKKRMKQQKQDSFYDLLLNTQTRRYLYRIIAFKLILSNPENYGFNIRKQDMYKMPKTKVIKVSKDIPNLIDFAETYKTSYKLLKELNPWLRSNKLTVKDGKTYFIKIPK